MRAAGVPTAETLAVGNVFLMIGADPMIVSAREGAAAPFEIGENAVAPLGVERVYPRFEEIVEIHCQAAAKGT